MAKNLTVSVSPHLHDGITTQTIMRDVLIALVPAVVASVVFFGVRALLVGAGALLGLWEGSAPGALFRDDPSFRAPYSQETAPP